NLSPRRRAPPGQMMRCVEGTGVTLTPTGALSTVGRGTRDAAATTATPTRTPAAPVATRAPRMSRRLCSGIVILLECVGRVLERRRDSDRPASHSRRDGDEQRDAEHDGEDSDVRDAKGGHVAGR